MGSENLLLEVRNLRTAQITRRKIQGGVEIDTVPYEKDCGKHHYHDADHAYWLIHQALTRGFYNQIFGLASRKHIHNCVFKHKHQMWF